MFTRFFIFLFCLLSFCSFCQKGPEAVLTFDFNDQEIKEKYDKVRPTHFGVTLIADRFGNERSAVLLRGDALCYLSLSSSELLKSPDMSISLWVNLHRYNYIGRGNMGNPIVIVKNGPGEDYINGIAIYYSPFVSRVGAVSTKDSTHEAAVMDDEPFLFNTWRHYALVCNDQYIALYVNGVLKQKTPKNFETKFLASDSMVIGHSASKKNQRMSIGGFDDIQIFHKSLTPDEVRELYESPNPNSAKAILYIFLKIAFVVVIVLLTVIILNIRNKRALKKQKEQFELLNRISELEIKVIKTQMNPHFISNSLAAIQSLILQNEVDTASQYLAKFSHFLRQILEYSEKNYVTLAEELSIIKMNVELEKLRFKDNFSFELLIEEGLDPEEFLIPSLITHPFIENAIWHGLLPLEDKPAHLRVSVFLKNDFGYISIEDNGVGRSPSASETTRTSMGSKLAREKIDSINQLRNNADFKLEIIDLFDADGRPSGTKVLIRLTQHSY